METTSERTDKILPGIAIDGQRIRTIREDKKLTQLYVASVVGVTTDTISRWENNRYPSIRRDNAEKLAAALEVPLHEILRREEAQSSEPAPHRTRRVPLLLPLLLLVVVIAGGVAASRLMVSPLTAVRWLPPATPPGQAVPVQIRINRTGSDRLGFIVHELLPAGWRLVTALPSPAQEQARGREMKWLIPEGTGPVTISYTTEAPAATPLSGSVVFSGGIVVHAKGISRREEIAGDRRIAIAPFHWADRNGDGRIDDEEIMPAYYLTEQMKGLGLDWNAIESIWSGKGYRWDEKERRYVVLH